MHLLQTEFTDIFCISVVHFLWMATIPWILWMAIESMLLKNSPTARYFGNVICLVAFALTIPFAVGLATNTTGQKTTNSFVASQGIDSKPLKTIANIPVEEIPLGHRLAKVAPTTVQQPSESTVGSWIESISPPVFFAYLAGVILLSIRFVNGFQHGHRMRRQASDVSDHQIASLTQKVASRLRMKTTPIVL